MFSHASRRSALRTGASPTPSSAASAASLTAEPGGSASEVMRCRMPA